jgi:hypothetical protein
MATLRTSLRRPHYAIVNQILSISLNSTTRHPRILFNLLWFLSKVYFGFAKQSFVFGDGRRYNLQC